MRTIPVTLLILWLEACSGKEAGESLNEVESFVPLQIYSQLRRTEILSRLPRIQAYVDAETLEDLINAPRLREALKLKKIQEVYEEEGYDDEGYDHGGFKQHGSLKEDFVKFESEEKRANPENVEEKEEAKRRSDKYASLPIFGLRPPAVSDLPLEGRIVNDQGSKSVSFPGRYTKRHYTALRPPPLPLIQITTPSPPYHETPWVPLLPQESGGFAYVLPHSAPYRGSPKYPALNYGPYSSSFPFMLGSPSHTSMVRFPTDSSHAASVIPATPPLTEVLAQTTQMTPVISNETLANQTELFKGVAEPRANSTKENGENFFAQIERAYPMSKVNSRHPSIPRDGYKAKPQSVHNESINHSKYVGLLTQTHLASSKRNGVSKPPSRSLAELIAHLNAQNLLSEQPQKRVKRQLAKYPFYDMPHMSQDSAMRYARNPKLLPKKTYGGMEFYESRERLYRCEDPPRPTNIVPTRSEDGEWNPNPQPEGPRMTGLGDVIQCLKVKYFGRDPFDNPFFGETVVKDLPTAEERAALVEDQITLPDLESMRDSDTSSTIRVKNKYVFKFGKRKRKRKRKHKHKHHPYPYNVYNIIYTHPHHYGGYYRRSDSGVYPDSFTDASEKESFYVLALEVEKSDKWWYPTTMDERRGEPRYRRKRNIFDIYDKILSREDRQSAEMKGEDTEHVETEVEGFKDVSNVTTTTLGPPISLEEFKKRLNITSEEVRETDAPSSTPRMTGGFISRHSPTYSSSYSSRPKIKFPDTKFMRRRNFKPRAPKNSTQSTSSTSTTSTTSTTTQRPSTPRMYQPKRQFKKERRGPVDAFAVLKRQRTTTTVSPFESVEETDESGNPRRLQQVEHRRVTKEEVFKTTYIPQEESAKTREGGRMEEEAGYSLTSAKNKPIGEARDENQTLVYSVDPSTGQGVWESQPPSSLYHYPGTDRGTHSFRGHYRKRKHNKKQRDIPQDRKEAYIFSLLSRVPTPKHIVFSGESAEESRSESSSQEDEDQSRGEDTEETVEERETDEEEDEEEDEEPPTTEAKSSEETTSPKYILDPSKRKYYYVKA